MCKGTQTGNRDPDGGYINALRLTWERGRMRAGSWRGLDAALGLYGVFLSQPISDVHLSLLSVCPFAFIIRL